MTGPAKGAVAAGDRTTAAAAAEILQDGGNAFDAAVAAMFTASVSEPVLCSLAAGGFLLARPAAGTPVLYDFFGQTPRTPRPVDELDFLPVEADFGTVQQEFHIGLGSVATPGLVAGAFAAHGDHGRLPMRRVIEPAVRAARGGVAVAPLQAQILDAVAPIFRWSEATRALFDSRTRPGQTLQAGEILRMPGLALVLEALAAEGVDLFYRGDLADRMVALNIDGGGLLRHDDLAGYRVERRQPLERSFAGATVFTNTAPSSGGPLIAFALELVAAARAGRPSDDDEAARLAQLARIMAQSNQARRDAGLMDECSDPVVARLLSAPFMADYLAAMTDRATKVGGTTHISVIDADGNAAALSVSNGEGCGHVLPGTDIMLNNMLGEEDTNPLGFFRWRPDSRVTSMMAPSIVERGDGRLLALGSGGSNRIRSAILQVLLHVLVHDRALSAAVQAPRIHFERGLLNIEHGFAAATVDGLTAAFERSEVWPDRNFFFGGVHAASHDPATAGFAAAGDPRRGGSALIVA